MNPNRKLNVDTHIFQIFFRVFVEAGRIFHSCLCYSEAEEASD